MLVAGALFLALATADALKVVVTGATGRTGRLVVERLLHEGHEVTALVRDMEKAATCLPNSEGLECRLFDLGTADATALERACVGADRLIWCATGFTPNGDLIDITAMDAMPKAFVSADPSTGGPSVVMLSSAGVTRTSWSDEKKEKLVGAADIPIIRLNPQGILEKKVVAEQKLRASGVPYCIVRPTGLKFEGWPPGRPILSQGDVAVGRTNPSDLARVLVDVLTQPHASGKTFEMFTLTGYPAARSLAPALEMLKPDSEAPFDEEVVTATYRVMQQLLPGEEQDATKLEMGRTYEAVDRGEVAARVRGAAPTEREKQLAAGIASARTEAGTKQGFRKLLSKVFSR